MLSEWRYGHHFVKGSIRCSRARFARPMGWRAGFASPPLLPPQTRFLTRKQFAFAQEWGAACPPPKRRGATLQWGRRL